MLSSFLNKRKMEKQYIGLTKRGRAFTTYFGFIIALSEYVIGHRLAMKWLDWYGSKKSLTIWYSIVLLNGLLVGFIPDGFVETLIYNSIGIIFLYWIIRPLGID